MFNMKYTITITNKMYEELWYYGKRNNIEVDKVASKAIALIPPDKPIGKTRQGVGC